jgi:hypothetical protein
MHKLDMSIVNDVSTIKGACAVKSLAYYCQLSGSRWIHWRNLRS